MNYYSSPTVYWSSVLQPSKLAREFWKLWRASSRFTSPRDCMDETARTGILRQQAISGGETGIFSESQKLYREEEVGICPSQLGISPSPRTCIEGERSGFFVAPQISLLFLTYLFIFFTYWHVSSHYGASPSPVSSQTPGYNWKSASTLPPPPLRHTQENFWDPRAVIGNRRIPLLPCWRDNMRRIWRSMCKIWRNMWKMWRIMKKYVKNM